MIRKMPVKKILKKTWRDAATLIIATKWQKDSYNLLMLKRSSESSFMPSSYVFPGGVKEAADFSLEWKEIFTSSMNYSSIKRLEAIAALKTSDSVLMNEENIKNNKDFLENDLGFRITALRETFEESGILIATNRDGENMVLSDPNEVVGGKYGTLKNWRDKVYENPENFLNLFRNLKISPAVQLLYDWSTWLTPKWTKTKRFNTMFYICLLSNGESKDFEIKVNFHSLEIEDVVLDTPENLFVTLKGFLPPPQEFELFRMRRESKELSPNIPCLYEWSNWLTPTFFKRRFHARFYLFFFDGIMENQSGDNREVIDSVWLKPRDLLHRYRTKELNLEIPQIYESVRMTKYSTFDELKMFTEKREKEGLELWCAHGVHVKDGFVLTYPGDDFHNKDPHVTQTDMSDTTISELGEKTKIFNRIECNTNRVMKLRNNISWCGHPPLGEIIELIDEKSKL